MESKNKNSVGVSAHADSILHIKSVVAPGEWQERRRHGRDWWGIERVLTRGWVGHPERIAFGGVMKLGRMRYAAAVEVEEEGRWVWGWVDMFRSIQAAVDAVEYIMGEKADALANGTYPFCPTGGLK